MTKPKQITWIDKSTGLEWTTDKSHLLHTWEVAIDYPKDELKDTSWKLANIHEFITLINYTTKKSPFKKAVPFAPNLLYWTKDEYVSNNKQVGWAIDMTDGRIYPSSKLNENHVLFVRKAK